MSNRRHDSISINRDGSALKKTEDERELLVSGLKDGLADVNMLNGLVPICSHCKKIRDDEGFWGPGESFIRAHANAHFTHGICPPCAEELYPEHFSGMTTSHLQAATGTIRENPANPSPNEMPGSDVRAGGIANT